MSILTRDGRPVVPVVMEGYHRARRERIRGQAGRIYRDGQCYVAVVVEVPEPPFLQPNDGLGVDLGLVHLAADSDGQTHSGGPVHGLRKRPAQIRQRLQKKGIQSAKRLLQKRRRTAHRFAENENHRIAKQLVAKAQGTGRGIALEDLTGIRDRITVQKARRRRQHSGAFHPLRQCLQYQAKWAAVPVALVNSRNTSRTCPHWGRIDKRNRPNQASFRCIGWGFAGPADPIAAGNIARRAAVNPPHAGPLREAQASSAPLGRGC
ncbi:MAG: transposase [Firmicutes bacterium]|nr:transposase [Bacillota bacterium]